MTFFYKDVIATGNGLTRNKSQQVPRILQYTKLRTISMLRCWREYMFLIFRNSVVCASGEDQQSVCKGDSGGPLVTADKGKLIGITSFVRSEGCDEGIPQGFTRVSSYLKWIKAETGISCQK